MTPEAQMWATHQMWCSYVKFLQSRTCNPDLIDYLIQVAFSNMLNAKQLLADMLAKEET